MPIDDLNAETIERAVRGNLGRPVRWFASVTSTNETALHWAARDAPHGALVVADHQTAGRGRWGRTWVAPRGRALLFSLVLRPEGSMHVELVTTALGVAVADAIRKCTSLDARVRWPNDVVVGGRKLAGILVETVTSSGSIDALVAGVGVNVTIRADHWPAELTGTATSLLQAAGAEGLPSRTDVLVAVLDEIERVLASLGNEPAVVIERATELSVVIGREVVARRADGSTISGIATKLSDDGALEVAVGAESHVLSSAEIIRIEPQ